MRTSWRSALPALAALLAAALPAPAQDTTDAPLTDEQIRSVEEQLDAADARPDTGGSDLWEEYRRWKEDDEDGLRRTGERVKVGDSVEVLADECVEGDVVSIGGNTVVRGRVTGDAVAIGGDVILHDGAVVDGDAVSVGGSVRELGDSIVRGEKVSVNIGLPGFHLRGPGWDVPRWWGFGADVALLAVGILLVFLLQAIAGRRLDVTSRRVDAEPGQSFLVGLLGVFATPIALLIAFVLLAITVIGLFLVPVLLILVWLMAFGGFAAVGLAVGRRLGRSGQELGSPRSPYLQLLIGFLVLHAFGILGGILQITGRVLGPVGTLLEVLGLFVIVFATTLGFGAVLLSRFGTQAPGAPAPGPPPLGPSSTVDPSRPAPTPPPPPPGRGPDDADPSPTGEAARD